jgi:prepilin-type processing-associated H-X9-DG protein
MTLLTLRRAVLAAGPGEAPVQLPDSEKDGCVDAPIWDFKTWGADGLPALADLEPGLWQGLTFNDDVQQDLRDKAFPRLKEGVERFFITDINNPAGAAQAQSTLIVMSDNYVTLNDIGQAAYDRGVEFGAAQMFNHVPGGANFLFMDGHVEFVRWGTPPCYLPTGPNGLGQSPTTAADLGKVHFSVSAGHG